MTRYLDISGKTASYIGNVSVVLTFCTSRIGVLREPLLGAVKCGYYSAMVHSHIITYALTLSKDW